MDSEIFLFFCIWLGLFLVLPICIYFALKKLLPASVGRMAVNVVGLLGVLMAMFMAAYPFVSPPTHSGGVGIIILIPLGALLGGTCLILLWRNNRKAGSNKAGASG